MSLKHRIIAGALAVCFALGATACATHDTPPDTADKTSTTTATTPVTADSSAVFSLFDERDENANPDLRDATVITLADNATSVQGDGANVRGNVVTIDKEGVYCLSGTLSDGQLRVDAENAFVHLVFDGVAVNNQTTAPLYLRRADKAVITLADGSQNALSDSAEAVYEDTQNQEPSGALFSKADLTINGNGSLAVKAAFQDGIVSRDGLKIVSGHIDVTAADDAVMGRDYVLIGGGELSLTADGDGIKSTNDGGEDVGFVRVQGGTLTVNAQKDGVQAKSALDITNGTLHVTAGGGSASVDTSARQDFRFGIYDTADADTAGKALKAGTVLTVSGGMLTLDAADDAVHSNDTVRLIGGDIEAASGDDGVHADNTLTISGGALTLTKSYEGLEAGVITVEGGDVSLTASDDGINASKGTSADSRDPMASDGAELIITGGTLAVNAEGDGLDSNGTITMCGGDVTVCGPSNGGNGTFDFASSMDITGGTLVAVGSMGMAQTPTSNTQQSIVWNGCTLAPSDTFALIDANGNTVLSLTSARQAQWAYITSPLLQEGDVYTVSDGSAQETLTLQAGQNTLGQAMNGHMGGPMGGGPMGGMPPHGGPMGRY